LGPLEPILAQGDLCRLFTPSAEELIRLSPVHAHPQSCARLDTCQLASRAPQDMAESGYSPNIFDRFSLAA
jgi:hypothetical protein